MLQCLYSDITAEPFKLNTAEPFKVTQGLCQGCVLSPTLFNLFINDLKIQTEGVKFGNLSLHSLLYAGDLAILAGNITDLQKKP